MKNVAIIYDSVHGQTRKIAEHLADKLQQLGIRSELIVTSEKNPASLEGFDAFLIGSPVYVGHYLSALLKYAKNHKEKLQSRPLGFFSVSLNAADQHSKARTVDLELLQKWIDTTGITPQYLASFAGGLAYRDYNWIVRWMLRRIAKKAGGDTDTSQNYEYTNWPQIDEFLQAFVEDNRSSSFALSKKMKSPLLEKSPLEPATAAPVEARP